MLQCAYLSGCGVFALPRRVGGARLQCRTLGLTPADPPFRALNASVAWRAARPRGTGAEPFLSGIPCRKARTRKEKSMSKIKKNERIFTPVSSVKHLLSLAEPRGDKTLFRYRAGAGYESMSYGTFTHRTLAEAAGLTAFGLAGKRIAVIGETSPEWVGTYLAAIAAGSVIIPMDKELNITEIEGFLSGVEAEAVVMGKGFAEKFAHAMESHPTLRYFFSTEEVEENDKLIRFETLLQKGEEALAGGYTLPDRDHENLAVMLFTSGTTGTSKCVMLSEKNVCTAVNAACASVEFFPTDTAVSILPIHHTYELMCMLALINYGATVGINDSLRHLMKNLAEFKPTGLVLVPLFVTTMYKKIQDEAKKKGKDKALAAMLKISGGLRHVGIDLRGSFFKSVNAAFGGHLQKIICGGAALNPEMVKKYDALGIRICEGYGITECSPLIAVTPYFAPKAGSVGPAVPGCVARIAATGKNEKGYDEGEIQVKGDNVMLGYYNNPEENAKAFTEDGWYRTGDVGYMDGDGYIYITGRMKSVIVLENGKNVFPEEIEEYLSEIPEIAEAVVVGREADGVVNLTAIVYPNRDAFTEGTSLDAMHHAIYAKIMNMNKKLPSFKKVKDLEMRDTEFEKTTSRKIKRHLVK